MERMEALWKDKSFLVPARLEGHIKEIFTRPVPDQVMLDKAEASPQPYFDYLPLDDYAFDWVRPVCKLRQCFHGIGVRVERADGTDPKVYLFATASQKPFDAMFTPLEPRIRNYCGASSGASLAGDRLGQHMEEWTFDPLTHVPECSVTADAGFRLLVYQHIVIGRDRQVHTDIPPVSWEEFLFDLPQLPPPKPQEPAPPRPKAKAEAHTRPYELEFKKHPRRQGKRRLLPDSPDPRSGSESSSSESPIKPEEVLPLQEVERNAYREYMDEYRAMYHDEFPDLEYFRIAPRGQEKNLLKVGDIFDSVRAGPVPGGIGERFLEHFGFNTSFSANCKTDGGRRLADLLCRVWRDKVNYFCSLWVAAGAGEFAFTQDMIDGFEEPPEFTATVADPLTIRAFVLRANWLRNMKPQAFKPL